MSAEKDIVNNWLNSRGFLTRCDIKASKHKNIDFLALKFDKEPEIWQVEVIVSVSGIVTDLSGSKKAVNKIIEHKFEDSLIKKTIERILIQYSGNLAYKKKIVLGGIPASSKKEIISLFKKSDIDVLEFEEIIKSVIQRMDTGYYKDPVIRTLQLVKYLLLSNPSKLADILGDVLNVNARSIFIKSLLSQELMQKEFSKADVENLIEVLKKSALRKPDMLAQVLEKEILTSRTRKPFIKSLIEQEKMGKIYKKETKVKKKEKPLSKFF